MSVNTSDDYLDELLQAIEPIIYPNGPEVEEEPVMEVEEVVELDSEDEFDLASLIEGEADAGTVDEFELVESDEFFATEVVSTDIPESDEVEISDYVEVETISIDDDTEIETVSIGDFADTETVAIDELTTLEEIDDDSAAIGDLLSAFSGDDLGSDASDMSEEDIDSMLSAASATPQMQDDPANYDQDVKELLKQFTEDEDLTDIQDMLDKNDNGEALDNSLLDIPEVEVFQLEEDTEADEDVTVPEVKPNLVSKVFGGLTGFFKKRKAKKKGQGENSDEPAEIIVEEGVQELSEADFVGLDEMSLLDSLTGGNDIGELELDEDMSDIEMLLTGGGIQELDIEEGSNIEALGIEDRSPSGKKGKKEKKESFFAKILNLLTEEIEEKPKKGVPEASATGITEENLDILESLSKEDKKKKKDAKADKKSKKKGKNASKDGDDEASGKGGKGNKAKKPKKKKDPKLKKVKEEVSAAPEKKLPKRRVRATFALCFSILAGILLLENVVSDHNNVKDAKYAFDTGDYETCLANLTGIERSKEEEALYQRAFIILSVERKLDAYENFVVMKRDVEALNSLLEGVAVYNEEADAALEWGVQSQITAIYNEILSRLQGYGLSEEDALEILGYESKVTYTKRLDSIVNGTAFVVEDEESNTVMEAVDAWDDVLPGEEDFLPNEEE